MPIATTPSLLDHDIYALLVDRTGNSVKGLVVHVDHECILIEGQARSYYVKQLATQAALGASDGRRVANHITVTG